MREAMLIHDNNELYKIINHHELDNDTIVRKSRFASYWKYGGVTISQLKSTLVEY